MHLHFPLRCAHAGDVHTCLSPFFGGASTRFSIHGHSWSHGNPQRISFSTTYKIQPHLLSPQALPHTTGTQAEVVQFPEGAMPTSSGYLPVSSKSNSRLFYVFYEATKSPTRMIDTPILLWLNGGPGCSSLIGCFYELGPWRLSEKGQLQPNIGAWNRRCGLLFVDNPVGAGFSIAVSTDDVPRDQYTVARHLYNGLQSFFAENPSFQKRPFFLAGESYAGKYIPSLAYYIMTQANQSPGHAFSQLAGIAIGNGLTDPRIQVVQHADLSLYLGLIDKQQSLQVREMALEVVELIDKAQWLEAHEKRTDLCRWIGRMSGIPTMLDIRRTAKYHHREDGTEYLAPFLNSSSVRAALKVDRGSPMWVSCRNTIRELLAPDTMKSTRWMVEAVLKAGYPVLLYQGVYDAKDGPASSEAWMRYIEWDHITNFWKTDREVWRVKGRLAGYWRSWKNLAHVVVQGAGHQVPVDQPLFSQVMIERWMQESLKAP